MTGELIDLIYAGKLRPAARPHNKSHRVHPEWNVAATVVDSGINLRATVYTTPSAVATSVLRKPVDGWTFWRLPVGVFLNSTRPPERRLRENRKPPK